MREAPTSYWPADVTVDTRMALRRRFTRQQLARGSYHVDTPVFDSLSSTRFAREDTNTP